MSLSSPIVRIASGLGIASFAFIAGFSVSSASSTPKAQAPIVDVNAWSETAPHPAASVTLTSAPAERCNPWDVSDVAMEEVLREMTRRGWRPPKQGDAVDAMEQLGITGISVDDPDAGMPRGGSGSSYIAVLSSDEAAQLRANASIDAVDQVLSQRAQAAPSGSEKNNLPGVYVSEPLEP
jgi:hypothetical protein